MEPVVLIQRSVVRLHPEPDPLRLISGSDRARWERLRRPCDRHDFLAARLLARDAVAQICGPGPAADFVQRCDSCAGPHGRPVVTNHDVSVSWAHAHGFSAAAACRGDRLGVDIDLLDPDLLVPDVGVTGRAFVRAEALVKAGAFDLDVVLELARHGELGWPGGRRDVYGLVVEDVPTGFDGVIAAVAWRRPTVGS
ncbi:hypothetical protein EU513_02080 [Yimella sp. RIT 621]|uniref:4'-phosphopantetheinyl transferase family protein n=1 Tax=Yimella sp. RIT 621 TaxID=2510323 RepID=UPI00101D8A94|nr:hypothetical protein [Yimella sp. RIT 621]RYG78428.1 hypothetical protein EU513_02080 [Yimella sp. RIT 621]